MTVSEKVLIYDQSFLIAAPGEPDCTDLSDLLTPAVPFRLRMTDVLIVLCRCNSRMPAGRYNNFDPAITRTVAFKVRRFSALVFLFPQILYHLSRSRRSFCPIIRIPALADVPGNAHGKSTDLKDRCSDLIIQQIISLPVFRYTIFFFRSASHRRSQFISTPELSDRIRSVWRIPFDPVFQQINNDIVYFHNRLLSGSCDSVHIIQFQHRSSSFNFYHYTIYISICQ